MGMKGNIVIAVDGGGSKTEFCVYRRDTGEARYLTTGATNYKTTAYDREQASFEEGMRRIFVEMDTPIADVRALVMGMAGYDSPKDYEHYLPIAMSTGIARERIYLCNDSELAFYSAGRAPGLCMIAGTGSIASAFAPGGRKARAGGWGFPVSDEGSGNWIGIEILRQMIRHCDGYAPHHPVYDDIRAHIGAETLADAPAILSHFDVTEIADVARVVMRRADAGDEVCRALIERAADLAAEISHAAYQKLHFEREPSVDIVMAGGLFRGQVYRRAYQRALKARAEADNLTFHDSSTRPVDGGIALAAIQFP